MNSTNLITNLLVALKTNYLNNNKYAYTKYNKVILNVLYVLYKDGLICGYQISTIDNKVKIKLKYLKNKPLIKGFNLISKPSFKIYSKYNLLCNYSRKYDYFFISTSNGIVSSRQYLSKSTAGGQVLFGLQLNNL